MPGFALWLLGYLGLAGAAALLWLVKRREPLGALQAFVSFGASPAGPTFPTFDNGAGLNGTTIAQLSAVGKDRGQEN